MNQNLTVIMVNVVLSRQAEHYQHWNASKVKVPHMSISQSVPHLRNSFTTWNWSFKSRVLEPGPPAHTPHHRVRKNLSWEAVARMKQWACNVSINCTIIIHSSLCLFTSLYSLPNNYSRSPSYSTLLISYWVSG